MGQGTQAAIGRLIALAALAAVLFASTALGAGDGGTQIDAGCARPAKAPQRAGLEYLGSTVQCLVNRVRARHGLDPLDENPELRRSATGHSNDMVAHHYFSHDGPSGSTIDSRVTRAGYLARASTYFVGENIGGGPRARVSSPIAVFRAWMNSPAHRANILDPEFHDCGVGVARGYPGDGSASGGATYTLDLGMRH